MVVDISRRVDEIPPEKVRVIPRKEFIEQFADAYQPGQHVTFLGPSGRGKTRLAAQLILAVQKRRPDIRVVAMHGKIKGRDRTIEALAKRSKMPVTTTYPGTFLTRYRARKRGGLILRPLDKAGENTAAEEQLLRVQYRKAIHGGYTAPRKHPVILLDDETPQTHTDLKLMRDMEGPLKRGRPVCGVWSLLQRGRFVSYHVYDQAEWVVMFYDPDRNNQERYSEIGDVDPKELIALTRQLETRTVADGSTISQALVFRRSGSQLFIVDT